MSPKRAAEPPNIRIDHSVTNKHTIEIRVSAARLVAILRKHGYPIPEAYDSLEVSAMDDVGQYHLVDEFPFLFKIVHSDTSTTSEHPDEPDPSAP